LGAVHNVSSDREKFRIYRCGGEVRYFGEEKVERIFIKGRIYPATKTTRCVGNLAGKFIGIICDPEIVVYEINYRDVFILIGTDSVFTNNDLNEMTV